MEVVLPVEVEIPSIRVLMEAKLTDAEWVHSHYDQPNLIEEKRLTAMCHGQLYQQRMKKAFDKKVKPRMFREGDLCSRRFYRLNQILGANRLLIMKAHMLLREPFQAVL